MKKALIFLSCMFFCCLLFLHSPSAVSAGIQGFYIWRDSLLPALLPFFVCSYVMQRLGLPSKLERVSLVLLALLSGAPAGARLMAAQQESDSRTAAILNTVSPMFIYASYCCGMLGAPHLALPVLTAHFAAAGAMLLLFPPKLAAVPSASADPSSLKLMGEGIVQGMAAMLNICGALIFFMALMAAVRSTLPLPVGCAGAVFCGMLEMVSGCAELARLSLPYPALAAASAFLFSFGGVCIFAQSLTLCRLNAGVYFSTKLLQGGLAALIARLIAPLFPSAAPVYSGISGEALLSNALSFLQAAGVSVTAMAAVLLAGAAARHKKFIQRT